MDIQKLMEQAQKMQSELTKIEEELNEKIYVGKSSDNVVVKISGRGEVQEVKIAEELMNPDDREMLQDMLLIAFNDAMEQSFKEKEQKLGNATNGLNIPGF